MIEKTSDDEMFKLLEQVITKVMEEDTVDNKDYNMVLTVTAVSLARIIEAKYIQKILEITNGSNTGKQSQKEGSGDTETA